MTISKKTINYIDYFFQFLSIATLIYLVIIYFIYNKQSENYVVFSNSNTKDKIIHEIKENPYSWNDLINKKSTCNKDISKIYPKNYKVGPLPCNPVEISCGCIWDNPDVNYYI